MKKKKIIILSSVGLIVITLMVIFYIFKVSHMNFVYKAKVIYQDNGNDISEELTAEELEQVKSILNNKILTRQSDLYTLSCPFSMGLAIILNDSETICIAKDGCDDLYWAEKNVYINIPEDKIEIIHRILYKHGIDINNVGMG